MIERERERERERETKAGWVECLVLVGMLKSIEEINEYELIKTNCFNVKGNKKKCFQ